MADRGWSGALGRPRAPLASSPEAAHHAALDFLARRPHFENELERKLQQKGFASGDVRAALDRLLRSKLLDDRRCAVEWVAARLRRAPQGRRRLRAELQRKGLAQELIVAVLDQAMPGDESDLAREAAGRFRRRRKSADPRALGRHLARLGFSTRDILSLSEESPELPPSDDDGC